MRMVKRNIGTSEEGERKEDVIVEGKKEES